jgi:hypothetical protein
VGRKPFSSVDEKLRGRAQGTQGRDDATAGPLFVDRASRNYRLLQGSPAISFSDTAYSPATDLDGTPRPAGAEDAGADESVGTAGSR